jgi:hypothetical protein
MVVVNRFRWFGWFALCVAVILTSYLTSSRVAAERKKLADVERSIASTDREIQALETEFDTRANLAQLQRWNGETLKLTVPTAQQYVRDEAQLADVNFDAQPDGNAKIQTAAYVMPSAPAEAVAAPQAQAQPQTVKAVVTTTAAVSAPASVRVAVAAVVKSTSKPKLAIMTASASAKPRTVAMLDRKLLSDSTLGDLLAGARAERRTR